MSQDAVVLSEGVKKSILATGDRARDIVSLTAGDVVPCRYSFSRNIWF